MGLKVSNVRFILVNSEKLSIDDILSTGQELW